jgi:hypothetical protein
MRLAKRGEIRFEQSGCRVIHAGAMRGVGSIKRNFLKFPLSRGTESWYAERRIDAKQEAGRLLKEGKGFTASSITLRFVYMYFLRLGLLDGVPGFRYCCMMAKFAGMIDNQMKASRRGLSSQCE